MVMVCHAKNLAVPDVSKEEPNSYVKVDMLFTCLTCLTSLSRLTSLIIF
jgi:hypothetical protein